MFFLGYNSRQDDMDTYLPPRDRSEIMTVT